MSRESQLKEVANPGRLPAFLNALRKARASQGTAVDESGAGLRNLLTAIGRIRAMASPEVATTNPIERKFSPDFLSRLHSIRERAIKDGRLLNVWTIAGLKRDEVRTAKVLSWILDCNGSHGFGSAVLHELIGILDRRPGGAVLGEAIPGASYQSFVEYSPFGAQENRVDLAIVGENCVIFIEVKIDAGEGINQIERYASLAHERARSLGKPHGIVLYLSQNPPSDPHDHVIRLRWRDVAKAIDRATAAKSERSVAASILDQFAAHLKSLH
ncbi:PD-(D/E)XK nuclease family protein [Rhizobium ruizarguesonis]|uniref:PD-(D/E)XK nuclease family protein n=1 Tax=Rhizobium ruizarguesonis TaxID=2081791 RepID=UPI0010310807|nr:PD-(D/E)XK nuclease family protein [Rhizobium ruizarguesonis]TBF31524.1 hypothetical protein ELG93_14855 [Rhizobium ruizarguesonis]